jgi:hypothetical protein
MGPLPYDFWTNVSLGITVTRFISAIIGFLLMVAYWPDFSGLATTPRWDVGVLIALVLFFSPMGRMSAAHWIGLALGAWLIGSIGWSAGPAYGVDTAAKLIVVCVAFAWGAALADPVPFVAGAAAGLAINSAVALGQWFGWHGIESLGSPAGLFWNGNRLAEVSALVLAAVLARRMWWALPGLVPALILPYGRGAWLTAAIVAAVWSWRRSGTFVRFVVCAIVGHLALFAAMTATLWRTEQFGLDALAERLAVWNYTVSNLSWLGRGLGSFAAAAPLLSWGDNVTLASHPHNEWLWLAYEGGNVAVGLCAAFAVWLWKSSDDCLRLVLVAIGLESLFAMPFHDPATVLFAAVVAGHLARDRGRVRDAAHDGGNALRGWRAIYGDRREPRRVDAGAGALSVR